VTPDHKALCVRLRGQDPIPSRSEVADAIEAIVATLSAREAALINTIARLTDERDAVQAVTVEACAAVAKRDEIYQNHVTVSRIRALATIPPHVAAARRRRAGGSGAHTSRSRVFSATTSASGLRSGPCRQRARQAPPPAHGCWLF